MKIDMKTSSHVPPPQEKEDVKFEKTRRAWRWWEFWGIVLGLPAAVLGIPAAGLALYDFFYAHHQDQLVVEKSHDDVMNQLTALNQKGAAHLSLAYAARPTDTIGENTSLLPPGQPILAQATSEINTPYLLEIDGTGAATLDTDAHFREKFGSKFKPNGQSWTIVALAADPASLTADRITQIQRELSTTLGPLNLPPGRQIMWTDTGWTWGKPANTTGRSPDPDSSQEVELSAHASAIESLLKTEFPNTPFLGRSFSVSSSTPTSQPAVQ